MKKILALILVLVMVLALGACSNGDTASSTPPATSSTPPASPSTPASPSQDATKDPDKTETPGAAGTIGFVTDDVDHFARDSYHVVYFNYAPTNVSAQMADALGQLGEKYNFTIEHLTANSDADQFITNLQTILIKNPDGLILDIRQEFASRTADILSNFDVPTIVLMNKALDDEGREIIPGVIMDQYYNGQRQMEYLHSVYKEYWPDVDPGEITLLLLDNTASMEMTKRGEGVLNKWEEFFPGQTYYVGDGASASLNAEGGYDLANSLMAAHPEVKYWFVCAVMEDLALGADRAVEALGKSDVVLITASGAAILPGEWDEGYDGCWIGNYAVSPFAYAGSGIFGLIALMDGRATKDTLWPDMFEPNDLAARFMLKADIMTRDNYKQYLNDIIRSFGIDVKD